MITTMVVWLVCVVTVVSVIRQRNESIIIRDSYGTHLLYVPRKSLNATELTTRLRIEFPDEEFTWNLRSMDNCRDWSFNKYLVVYRKGEEAGSEKDSEPEENQ